METRPPLTGLRNWAYQAEYKGEILERVRNGLGIACSRSPCARTGQAGSFLGRQNCRVRKEGKYGASKGEWAYIP